MPLQYDDIDGSWGHYSKDWPSTHEHAHAKWVFANKTAIIPYGSYVLMDNHCEDNKRPCLRVETQELLNKLNENFNIVRQVIIDDMFV